MKKWGDPTRIVYKGEDKAYAATQKQNALRMMGVLENMYQNTAQLYKRVHLSDGGIYTFWKNQNHREITIEYNGGGEVGSYSPYLFIGCRFHHDPGWQSGTADYMAQPNLFIYEPTTIDENGEEILGELLVDEFWHSSSDAFTAQHPLDLEFQRSDNLEEFNLGRYKNLFGGPEVWLTHTSHNFCLSATMPWDPKNGINIDEDYDFDSELKWQVTGWLDPEDPQKTWTRAAPIFHPEVEYTDDDNVDIYKSCAITGTMKWVKYDEFDTSPYLVDGTIELEENGEELPTEWSKRGQVQGGWYVIKIGARETLCGLNTEIIPEVEIRLGRPPNQLVRRYTLPEIEQASAWFRDIYPYGYYKDFGQTDYFGDPDELHPRGGYGENPHGYCWWKGAFLINVGTGQIAVDIDDLVPVEGRIRYYEGDTLDNQYLPDDTSFYEGSPESEKGTQSTEGLCNPPPLCEEPEDWPYGDPTDYGSFRFETPTDKYYKASPDYLFDGVCSVVCRYETTLFNDGESPFLTGVVQHESGEFYTGSIPVYDPDSAAAISRAEDQIANLEFGDECYIVGIKQTVVDIDPDTGERTWVKDVQVVFLPEPLGDGWEPYDPLTS